MTCIMVGATVSARCLSSGMFFFFSSRRRHTRFDCDWSSDVCSSDLTARKFRPQAISLDLRLPDMEGYALLDYLKHNAELRHVPVVVLSGGDDPERALRAGAFAYMKKPAERDDLVQALLKIQVFLSRQPKHLLIVEDNDIQRRNLIDLLAGEDVATESAGTAEIGRTYCRG